MSLRQNLNSSWKSSLVALKWDNKLNFAFCDIQRVFTDRITNDQEKVEKSGQNSEKVDKTGQERKKWEERVYIKATSSPCPC